MTLCGAYISVRWRFPLDTRRRTKAFANATAVAGTVHKTSSRSLRGNERCV
jgi:hypothetical protein